MNIYSFYEKYFGKEIYFIWSYTIIHFILILYAFYKIDTSFTPPVFYKFTLFGTTTNIFNMYSGIQLYLYSYISIILIFLIDVAFLIILMLEFKWMRLNYTRILLFEFVLLLISFFSPFFRETMFFMSFNTVGIYLIYRIILKNIWFFKFPILFCSYIFIFRLLLSPIIDIFKMR